MRTCCIFPSCCTEVNGATERELERNWVPSTEKWTVRGAEKQWAKLCFWLKVGLYLTPFVGCMCMCKCMFECVCVCGGAAYVSEWQKVSKLTVLTCGLARGALEEPWTSAAPDEELGSAWNGVWFSTWSPRGSAQSCRDWDSAPLRWAFQKETVQLHRVNTALQELQERSNRCNDTILSLFKGSVWDSDIKKLLIRKREAYKLHRNNKCSAAFKEVQMGHVTNSD